MEERMSANDGRSQGNGEDERGDPDDRWNAVVLKKRREINTHDPSNWVRAPGNYPDFPPRSIRKWANWDYTLRGYVNGWYDFLCGIVDTPPLPSGSIGGEHREIALREYRKRNGIPEPEAPKGEAVGEIVEYRSAIKDFVGRPIPPEGELRVWLDDDPVDREAPEGWVHVRSAREACFLLLSGRVVELSLDNDLNNSCVHPDDNEEEIEKKTRQADENLFGSGFQVLDFLEEQHFTCDNPLWPRDGIAVHAANSNARERMERTIETVGRQEGVTYEVVRSNGKRARHLIKVES
jgi:hypothetical protein